jgi:hypothetical protein
MCKKTSLMPTTNTIPVVSFVFSEIMIYIPYLKTDLFLATLSTGFLRQNKIVEKHVHYKFPVVLETHRGLREGAARPRDFHFTTTSPIIQILSLHSHFVLFPPLLRLLTSHPIINSLPITHISFPLPSSRPIIFISSLR